MGVLPGRFSLWKDPAAETRSVPIFHVVLVGLALVLFVGWWALVQTSPTVLSRLLPPRLTLAVGAVLLVLAGFSAFAAAHFLRDPRELLGSLVTGLVGLWFMMATVVGARGSERYEVLMKHLMPMVAILFVLLVASLYVESRQVLALLQALMILGGFVLTTRYFRMDA